MSVPGIDQGDALAQLPKGLQQWLELERFHLHKAEGYQQRSRDPDFDVRYFPQHCDVFRLPCCLVPRRNLHVFVGQQPSADALNFFHDVAGDGQVLFPMHPSAVPGYQEFLAKVQARDAQQEGICIWAVPTSSTRTVLAWPDGAPHAAVFIKTSLHSPIFGNRRIDRIKAGRSVALSALVNGERNELPEALSCLPECFAFTARTAPHTGSIIRSIPGEFKGQHVRAAPLFSLLGGDRGRRPLLLTIFERTGMAPLQFVHEALCAPFASVWLRLCMDFGLMIESHGQDLLLELAPDLAPTGRFYYRDFEGLQVDWELRRRCGRPPPDELPQAWRWSAAYEALGASRYSHLLWYKWRISLLQYLHFVLHEMESSLREWHQRGLINGRICAQDEVTDIFSEYLFAALERMFNVRIGPSYNIYRSLNRFLILLAKLRRQALGTERPGIAGFAA